MKVGILGTGDVGKALGCGFIKLGHEVFMGSRDAQNPKALGWAKESGGKAGSFGQAAEFGEIVVLATLGTATQDAIRLAGPEKFKGKLVFDTTNPLDFSRGMPPRLVGGLGDSAGEKVQTLLADAQVVKVFNTVGNSMMFRPQLKGGPPDMFICGNSEPAKKKTAKILVDFGWNAMDVGDISASHYLEALCVVWVMSAVKANSFNQAFKLLK